MTNPEQQLVNEILHPKTVLKAFKKRMKANLKDGKSMFKPEMVEKILKAAEGPFETVPADREAFIKWLEGK